MPYGKRYTKKSYRKRNYRSNYSLAKKAYRLAKKAYKLPEVKYAPVTGTITGPTSTGSIQQLSVIPQGSTNVSHVGDLVSPTSVYIRLKAALHASATQTQLRMIIFRWKSEGPSGVTDILQSADITSFKNENYRYQSNILWDKVYTLNTNYPEMYLVKKVKLGKRKMSIDPTNDGAATNGIYILLISDEATNVPVVAYNSRLYFKDA